MTRRMLEESERTSLGRESGHRLERRDPTNRFDRRSSVVSRKAQARERSSAFVSQDRKRTDRPPSAMKSLTLSKRPTHVKAELQITSTKSVSLQVEADLQSVSFRGGVPVSTVVGVLRDVSELPSRLLVPDFDSTVMFGRNRFGRRLGWCARDGGS